MTVLDEIVAQKLIEVKTDKAKCSLAQLEQSELFGRTPYSLSEFLLNPQKSGIICEFKRQSPSKGLINGTAKPEEVTLAYNKAGASAISVLTDQKFFGGKNEDLIAARKVNDIPILRKDFIIDEYQIVEAKSIGADVILLIAAILDYQRCEQLAKTAKQLGLSVLMEVHTEKELELCNPYLDVVGVNNRNLKTFEVDVNYSIHLFDKIPHVFVKISESGISNTSTIKQLKKIGFQGFLIGENFMKTDDPGKACMEFIDELSH